MGGKSLSMKDVQKNKVNEDEMSLKIESDLFHTLLALADKIQDVDTTQQSSDIVNDVIAKAISLMLRSEGQDITLRNRQYGTSEFIKFWK